MNQPTPKMLLTPAEACDSLGIGRTVYFQLVKEGRLRTVTIGRSRRVTVEALAEFVASLTAAAE